MANPAVESFYQKIVQTPALQEQFKSAKDEAALVDLAVKLGAQNGFAFTAADVKAKLAEGSPSHQLSDRELETVAGGATSLGGSMLCGYCGAKSGSWFVPSPGDAGLF